MKYKFINLSLVALIISSCATTHLAEKSIASTQERLDANYRKLASAQSIANNNFNVEMNGIYISNTPVTRKEISQLPPRFYAPVQIDAAYTSMRQVADVIQRLSGYPVLVDIEPGRDFYLRLTQQAGSLFDLLNNLCAQTDTAWSFINGKLLIADLQTETFFIKALPGDIQVQNQVNSTNGIQAQSAGAGATGSGGGSSGGGAQTQVNATLNTVQNVQFNLTNSIWANLADSVRGMLSRRGNMTIAPSTSSITVIDKPSNIVKVSQFVKKQNEMLQKQVQIDVQVFTVETSAEDNYMLNWNVILDGSNATFNMNGQTLSNGGSSGGDGKNGLNPVFAPTATTQSFTVAAQSGSLSGSQLVANALSSKTRSSLVTSAAATTLNNQPVPIQVVEQQGYVASISTTQINQGGVQQAVNTGQLSYGFTLNVLPTIEANDVINLQISLNLSSLKSLKPFAAGSSMLQLPDMIQRNAMQKVTMHNGDTYVTTGFDSDFNTITNAGVGSPRFWLLGGGVSAQKSRQKLVVLVTPRIIHM